MSRNLMHHNRVRFLLGRLRHRHPAENENTFIVHDDGGDDIDDVNGNTTDVQVSQHNNKHERVSLIS